MERKSIAIDFELIGTNYLENDGGNRCARLWRVLDHVEHLIKNTISMQES